MSIVDVANAAEVIGKADETQQEVESENGNAEKKSNGDDCNRGRNQHLDEPKSPGSHRSVTGYDITQERGQELWKPIWAACACQLLDMIALFIVNFLLSFSLNEIYTDDKDRPTRESATVFTSCISVAHVFALLIQEFWAKSGGWFGRKVVIISMNLLLLCGTALSAAAHWLEAVTLHGIAAIFLGFSSGTFATLNSYVADCSTKDTMTKNQGMLQASAFIGVFLGGIIGAVLPMTLAYGISALFPAIEAAVAAGLLYDWSPPPSKRSKPTSYDIVLSMAVCNAYKAAKSQSFHTIFLLLGIACDSASFNCIRLWLFNYALDRFGFTSQTAGLFILCYFLVGGINLSIATRFIEAKLGANMLSWSRCIVSLIVSVGPSHPAVLWSVVVLGQLPALAGAFHNALYVGQVSARRRGELVVLQSVTVRLGGLAGTGTMLLLIPAWLDNNSSLPPPVGQLFFDLLGVVFYYIARCIFGTKDQYGINVLRIGTTSSDI